MAANPHKQLHASSGVTWGRFDAPCVPPVCQASIAGWIVVSDAAPRPLTFAFSERGDAARALEQIRPDFPDARIESAPAAALPAADA